MLCANGLVMAIAIMSMLGASERIDTSIIVSDFSPFVNLFARDFCNF